MQPMVTVLRIERSPKDPKWDSRSRRVLKELPVFFPKWGTLKELNAVSSELFWIANPQGKADAVRGALLDEVLRDPLSVVSDQSSVMPKTAREGYQWWCLEKTLRPGVTDNAGHVLAEALKLVTNQVVEARSGSRLWLELPKAVTQAEVRRYAEEVFYNALIEKVEVWTLDQAKQTDDLLFERPTWFGIDSDLSEKDLVETVRIRELSPEALEKMSTDRLWALSRSEMQCVQAHYRKLERDMTDVEIEVIAQTWSEHCKHKIFAANIEIENDRTDIKLPKRVESVFKTYIRGATREVPAPYLKSVFEDNAGVIQITDKIDCAIKVETHNSPSALDPYGGALTGIVGVNRDILGVGLGAHPIANLDVFCVGPLDAKEPLPPRLHHPRRILEGVRVGVEHGGNKSGIPTVTGAVVHHPGYLGKPLVFCGTIGILPNDRDFITKTIIPGDLIVMAGGRIGKDGIHGATFSSLEMNKDSPVSAVQLGDPLTQRRVWDFLIEARDLNLFRAVTDNGAGGLSSSIGELARLCGKKGGARMDVAKANTKYPGLKPYELVVSESQERMSFAVPNAKLDSFLDLARKRGVETSVLGEFEDSGRFQIYYKEKSVADLDMHFLHEGLPAMELRAKVSKPISAGKIRYGAWQALGENAKQLSLAESLPQILALPNVCSRRAITTQYDHEVQARSIRKPYGTPNHGAPNDGATLVLDRTTFEGLALGIGLAPNAADIDPKVAAELALDEALRNAAVAGMDPSHAALVDNFCWPDPVPRAGEDPSDAEAKLGALVVTCQRIFDGAVTLKMPFVSGKDSMKNDYRMGDIKISVPPTLLITTMGKVHDVRQVPKGYATNEKREILWVSAQDVKPNPQGLPKVDFDRTKKFLEQFHSLIRKGLIESAHDVSDGGWLVTTAEMLFGTEVGAKLADEKTLGLNLGGDLSELEPQWAKFFGEPATSFVWLVKSENVSAIKSALDSFLIIEAGQTTPGSASLECGSTRWRLSDLHQAYEGRS